MRSRNCAVAGIAAAIVALAPPVDAAAHVNLGLFLAEHGRYSRAVSTFPSLTPVCLSSIATGAHPDIHRIPHLVWYDRERARIIEYGSSFAALRAAGMARSILDAIINMNRLHLSPDAVTVYEALDDAGFGTAAINITCYRGRTRHLPTLPGVTIPGDIFPGVIGIAPSAIKQRRCLREEGRVPWRLAPAWPSRSRQAAP